MMQKKKQSIDICHELAPGSRLLLLQPIVSPLAGQTQSESLGGGWRGFLARIGVQNPSVVQGISYFKSLAGVVPSRLPSVAK